MHEYDFLRHYRHLLDDDSEESWLDTFRDEVEFPLDDLLGEDGFDSQEYDDAHGID